MGSVQVKELSCSYGKRKIIDTISFSVPQGACMAVLGDNGCGKSTLLQVLAGIKKQSAGEVLFFGKAAQKEDFRTRVGYVPQENMLVENCSVLDNLCLWYQDRKELAESMENGFLKEFGVTQMAGLSCARLSGGMKKKVSIACALAGKPDILLLDEPCAALDLSSKKRLRTYLQEYAKNGHTVIFATHEEADFAICTQMIKIEKGKCIQYEWKRDME